MRAGLTAFLKDGNTSQTVFAPINAAWQGRPEARGPDNSRKLTNLMLFHVVLGEPSP